MTNPTSLLRALAAGALLAPAACTTGPVTGQTVAEHTAGYQMLFEGFSDTPNTLVTAHVLANANDGPRTGTYVQIGSGKTSADGSDLHDARLAYGWSFRSSPLTTTQWRPGGLVRFKTRSAYGGLPVRDMITFDTTGVVAARTAYGNGQSWIDAGTANQSPYQLNEVITVASTEITPAEKNGIAIRYLGVRGGAQRDEPVEPRRARSATENYYATIGAPPTLAAFKARFGLGGGADVRATYYNAGDLGIARDMHCRRTTVNGAAVTACYVSNYGRAAGIAAEPAGFGPDHLAPETALAQALGSPIPTPVNGPFAPVATVAMTFDTAQPADRRVQFMVYDQFGNLSPYAALDNRGLVAIADDTALSAANINVPDNCLTCHGPSSRYSPTALGFSAVENAHFLPFDPDAFVFSATDPAHSRSATLPAIKQLNALVWDTSPAPATIELLQGMYPSASGAGPKDGATTFTSNFVPAGWNDNRASRQVYKEVVKPYCRSCHVSHDPDGLDFSDDDYFFGSNATKVGMEVCTNNSTSPMPQAEQTQTRMWRSGARAHLANALALSGACAP